MVGSREGDHVGTTGICPGKLDNCIIIDLRSRGYFLISHISNALNLVSLSRIGFIAQENPDKRIVLYCHSGASAADFGSKLVEMGYKNIYYLDENFFEYYIQRYEYDLKCCEIGDEEIKKEQFFNAS